MIIYPVYWNEQTISLSFQQARCLFIRLIDNTKLCGFQNFSIIIYSLGGKRNQAVVSITKLFPSLVLSNLYSKCYNSLKLQQTLGNFELTLNRVPALLIAILTIIGKFYSWNRQTYWHNFVPETLPISINTISGLLNDAFSASDCICGRKVWLLMNGER